MCECVYLTCLPSTMLSRTEVTMEQTVLTIMKIIILCQRLSGILVAQYRKSN